MRTILVVDDDRDVCEAIEMVLASEGYGVVTARDGVDALAAARRAVPDAILLDLMMPGMSGWQFLDTQRGDATLAAIPTIVMTAAGESEAIPYAEVHLRKPFDVEALVMAVERVFPAAIRV